MGNDGVPIDLNIGPIDTAIKDDTGPLRNGHILHGREMDHDHHASNIPDSSGGLKSSVWKELDGDKYGKSYADREKAASGANSDETV